WRAPVRPAPSRGVRRAGASGQPAAPPRCRRRDAWRASPSRARSKPTSDWSRRTPYTTRRTSRNDGRASRPSGSRRAGHDSHPAMEQVRTLNRVVIADSIGVRPVPTTADLRDLVANIDFCWLDVSVRDEAVRTDVLAQLGLVASDVSWALRFGQSPRMVIDRRGLRAVTWLADAAGDVAEVHVLCSQRGVVTVWSGDPVALD